MKKFLFITIVVASVSCVIMTRKNHQDDEYHCKIIESGGSRLRYDNMVFKDTILCPYILGKKQQSSCSSNLPSSVNELNRVSLRERVKDDIFRRLLNFNSVNKCFSVSSGKDNTERILKSRSLYYCGKVNLSNSFDGFLFLLLYELPSEEPGDEPMTIKDLFLVCLSDNSITSISNLFSYFCWDGHSMYRLTKYNGNDTYLYYDGRGADDIVHSNGSESIRAIFSFDKQGRVVLK